MATTLRPRHSYPPDRTIIVGWSFEDPPLGFGANAARRLGQACHVLAQLIDMSLTAVFLIADVALAGSLLLTTPGLTLE